MKSNTIVVALAGLAIGTVAGWCMKPAPAKTESAAMQKSERKSRIAESKSRVKMVTTVVTNTIHDTVTNTVEVMRERPNGPEGFMAELERLKKENPSEYASRTNRMAMFRNRMLQRTENRLQTLAAIDTTGWSKQQIATHEHYQKLIAKQEELMDMLRPDIGVTESDRREIWEQIRNLGRELHATGQEERETLMDQTLKVLGYTGSDAAEIKEAISTIYSTTQDWGGGLFGGRRGRRGTPPPPQNR